MGERQYYSEFDLGHEQAYAELERLKSENYHLRRQLQHANNINRGQKKKLTAMEKKLKKANGNQQHYRNGRKRGSNGFNG